MNRAVELEGRRWSKAIQKKIDEDKAHEQEIPKPKIHIKCLGVACNYYFDVGGCKLAGAIWKNHQWQPTKECVSRGGDHVKQR